MTAALPGFRSTSLRGLISTARLRGWTVTYTPGGHVRFAHPDGGLVHAASTPSDYRAVRNIAAELRRQETQQQGRRR